MKHIKLSIKNNYLSDTYTPKFKKYDNILDIDVESSDDLDILMETISLYVHSFYIYRDNIRGEQYFKEAHGLLLDFDNKKGHNDSTITEFLTSEFADTYNWILYTSKSHISDVQDCFHVFLPLDTPITTINGLNSAYKTVYNELLDNNIRCDTQVHDGARLIYPSIKMDDPNPDFFVDSNFTGQYYYFDESDIVVDIKPITLKPNKTNGDITQLVDNKYVEVFRTMSKLAQYRYIKSVLSFMNTTNRKNRYSLINYNMWIGIGFSLYQHFGYSDGIKLFKILSNGYPTDTEASIEAQFRYLTGDKYHPSSNIDIIIRMSSKLGFNHSMYFKYYFMSRHIFSHKDSLKYFTKMQRILMNKYKIYENYNDVTIFNYTDKKNTRCFLMEVRNNDVVKHITIRLGDMMDIMANLLNVDREFITTSVTRGIIRRFININGVYNLHAYARNKIISNTDNTYIKVSDINSVMAEVRSYAPTTIHKMLSNRSMQQYLTDIGFLVNKKKRRVGKRTYMMFRVDLTKSFDDSFIFIENELLYKVKFYEFSVIENCLTPNRTTVMQC